MIVSFRDAATSDVYEGRDTATARSRLPATLWRIARRKLDQMEAVSRPGQLAVPPGNRLERLSGDRQGQYSIRINDQYRICFDWTASGPASVEITDHHRG